MSRSLGATEFTSRSSMRISPDVTVSRPAIIASRVDFPQPDGPTSAMNSPSFASMSTPFSTSTGPKRLRRDLTVNVAMARLPDACAVLHAIVAHSLHRSGRQPAHEVSPAKRVDQESWQCRDDDGRALHAVLRNVGDRGRERDQGGGDRLLLAGRECHAIEELVPDVGELPDNGDDQYRGRERQDDAPERPKETGAVDTRSLDQFLRDRHIVIAAEQRGE